MRHSREAGARLRAARRALNLTLKEASDATGLCESTLSRLESGKRQACLEIVVPLADLYGISLDALVINARRREPPVPFPTVIHRRDSVVMPLTHSDQGQRCSKMLLPATRRVPHLCRHEGHEWLCVLSGRLRLVVGEEELALHSGQSAEFDTDLPHWFGTDGRGPWRC